MIELIKFIPLFPLFGFLLIGLAGKYMKNEKLIGTLGSATVGISFILSVLVFLSITSKPLEEPVIVPVYTWLQAGFFNINISYQADQLSVLFSLIITGV